MKILSMETMKEFKPKYKIGEFVYLKSDPEQLGRQVVAYYVTHLTFQYCVVCGADQTNHFEFELNKDRNVLISLN